MSLVVGASLQFKLGDSIIEIGKTGLAVTVTGTVFTHNRQTIGTSEEAIVLGDVTTGGWFAAINHDATNFIEIRSGTGATDLVKMLPGEPCMFRMSGDSSAPFAIADTGSCVMEYVILPA